MPEQAAPTAFAESLWRLDDLALDQLGQDAVQSLGQKGYEVWIGLRREDVSEAAHIAGQTGVQEFCPNDMRTRFGDETMAGRWHEKGRLFFQLRRKIGGAGLAGYGWTGPETCEELPGCRNTFAIRLSEEVAGQGLATPFTTAIVSGSLALGLHSIGLETWEGNIAARRVYEKAGAEYVGNGTPGSRLTVVKRTAKRIRRRQIPDTRRFMQFTRSFPTLSLS